MPVRPDLAARVLDAQHADCLVLDRDDAVLLAAGAAVRSTVSRGTTVEGAGVLDLVARADRQRAANLLAEVRRGGRPRAQVLRTGDGCAREVVLQPLGDGVLVEAWDVSVREEREELLRTLALTDPLTGLPNRVLVHDRLRSALAPRRSGRPEVGVLYLDLDGFKTLNDRSGHEAGDRVLQEAARRMSGALRPGDTLGRLGGDEFAVVCPDVRDALGLEAVARRLLRELAPPYTVRGLRATLTASVGGALSLDGSAAPGRLLAVADQAMYEAKAAGGGQVQLRLVAGDLDVRVG